MTAPVTDGAASMAKTPRIATLTLQVRNPEALAEFYCATLGMSDLSGGDEIAVGYGGQGARLVLQQAPDGPAYRHETTDRYWKIAITVPNLDLVHQQLTEQGVAMKPPRQFRDIAYMSHIADPEGYVIEVLQHTFEGAPRTSDGDPNLPLGGGAQIGLITLRTNDLEADLAECRGRLGLQYLSRQAVTEFGFDLYFLAPTAERPPNSDVNAVENREWLWQRPYTVLEFQHRLSERSIIAPVMDGEGAALIGIAPDLTFR